jgi:hypothetical protein
VRLPFSPNASAERLANGGGVVWPVGSSGELEQLVALARVFGTEPQEVESQVVVSEVQPFREELVIGLNEATARSTTLYAHLTGRSARLVQDVAQVLSFPNAAVVLAFRADLTPEFFDVISQYCTTHRTLGIVVAESEEALQSQVLLRSAARHFSSFAVASSEQPRYIDILPTLPFSQQETAARSFYGASANRDTIIAALKSAPRLLRVVTASDGVDADLGSGLILCHIHARLRPPTSRSPSCIENALCHRLMKSITQIRTDSRLIDPEMIRSQILIWQTCQGVLTGSHVLDSEWGIGWDLIASPTIGAVIATCDFVLSTPVLTETLVMDIAHGVSIGESLAMYSRSSGNLAHRLFLFGDPSIALPSNDISIPHLISMKVSATAPQPASVVGTPVSDDLEFMTKAVLDALPAVKRLNATQAAFYEALGVALQSIATNNLFRTTAHKSLLVRYLCERKWARSMDDWWRFVDNLDLAPQPSICANCTAPADTYHVSLAGLASDRRQTICRRCGPIEDAPARSNIRFRIATARQFCISGDLPSGDWVASFLLFCDVAAETQILPWPKSKCGMPVSLFQYEGPLPRGPVRAGFCMIHDSWHLLTLPFLESTRFSSEEWQTGG